MKKILLFIALPALIWSCERPDKIIKSEPLELRQLSKTEQTVSRSSGAFFFVVGGYSSQTKQEKNITVCALVDGRYMFVDIDIRNVRIVIDDALEKPYLILEYRIEYRDNTYEQLISSSRSYKVRNFVIVCPEKYLPENLLTL